MKEIDEALAREREQKGKEANDDNIRIYQWYEEVRQFLF